MFKGYSTLSLHFHTKKELLNNRRKICLPRCQYDLYKIDILSVRLGISDWDG